MEVVKGTGFIEIEIVNWDVYNTKSDQVRNPNWFRLSRDIGTAQGLCGLSAAEKWIWVLILAERCRKKTKTIKLNILWLMDTARESEEVVRAAIEKLINNDTIRVSCHPTDSLLTVQCQSTERVEHTGQDTTEHTKQEGGGSASGFSPSNEGKKTPPAEVPFLGTVHKSLAGNSKRDQALKTVPIEIQQEWVDTYELKWLKDSLLHAIQNYSKNNPIELVKDWPEKFARWFKIEKMPRMKPKLLAEKARDPTKPHSLTPITEILSRSPELAALRTKVKSL